MELLFLTLHRFFKRHKSVFWIIFVAVVGLMTLKASRITFEEDITKFFPNDSRVEKLNYVFQNAKFIDRLVMMISVKDSTLSPEPDNLVAFAEALSERIQADLNPYIRKVSGRVNDEEVMEIFQSVHHHLPVFLDEHDYAAIDSLIQPEMAKRALLENYKQLISPSGMVLKNTVVNDPLGISFLVLRKLQQLQYDDNFELYDNYIITKDHRHLIFFIEPFYPANETKNNSKFLEKLDGLIAETSTQHEELLASYFGTTVVAVGNANQLRKDTILTISMMVILLLIVLLGFFRRKRVPVLIFIPVVFGALFSLCCISFIQESLSILALAVGAVILGIAVDYSLHFLVHLKRVQSFEQVIKDLAKPLTIGSTTTVLAFLSLQFANASVLRDIGLFAGLSLIGAALCALIVLPHLTNEKIFDRQQSNRVEKFFTLNLSTSSGRSGLVFIILLLTPVFFYVAGNVKFNHDMNALNFMKEETREAQQRLETINKASLRSVYLVSFGNNLEEVLRKNERLMPEMQQMKSSGLVNKVSSVSSFLISDSLQRVRIEQWNKFWTTERKENILKVVTEEGSKLKFSSVVFSNFDSLLSKRYKPIDEAFYSIIRSSFFDDFIIEKDSNATVITLVQVYPQNKNEVYQRLENQSAQTFDRTMITNLFIEYVHADFNFIVAVTSVIVFIALLIVYGRIELTLITFLPMLFTWIWILGIMALLGIEFNIINVIVSTFIFGLGDDYSIFVMDGLQQQYKAGKNHLSSTRTSIFLSAATTISGLGVLIFAQHPALKSIAAISIIGIVSVFVMSQTIQPFLFHWLITNRVKKGFAPITFFGICKTFFLYGFFVTGSFFLTIVGLFLKLIPFGKKNIRTLYHHLIRFFTWSLVYLAFNIRKKIINRTRWTFSRSSVIISNHASFLDILVTTMLHPKVILLTNKWVWNSPVFGGVVRLADYYPVIQGVEDSVEKLKERINEGYSIVVFPEGSRSSDGKIRRFHKGAFYMAEQLKLPILPLLIHGAHDGIRKTDMYLNDASITLKFLPPIRHNDKRFGETYTARCKTIGRYFKDEHNKLALQEENPDYFVSKLITNYLYKGPVLEWYLRVKLKLEKNYALFHQMIPRRATILDLGCGYGFLCYMLQLLSEDRIITGVDYDEEKIETAANGYLKTDRLQFVRADVMQFPLQQYDVIILSDVLHYLSPAAQEQLLVRCFGALNAGGKLIVRDGDADLLQRHKRTKLTEFFSVNILKFNKSVNTLNFISGEVLMNLAHKHGLEVSVKEDSKLTSNVIFVISKPTEILVNS